MTDLEQFRVTPNARLLIGLFALAAALHGMNIGTGPAALELDPSWTAVLGWAAVRDLAFGKDVVFSYGPLGFLFPTAAYVPGVYTAFLAGQLALAALFALSCYTLLSRLRPQQRLLYCAAGFICAPWLTADVVWLLFLAQNGVLLCLPSLAHGPEADGRWNGHIDSTILPAVLGFAAAAMALIKFSLVPVAVIMVLATATSLSLDRHRRSAACHVAGMLVGFVGLWMLSGQAVLSLPGFFTNSLEVVAGYGSTMGLLPLWQVDLLGFGSMALSGGWLGWQVVAQRSSPSRALLLFALGCVAFIAWRQGFTRADRHVQQAPPLFALLPLLGIFLHRQISRTTLALGLAAGGFAILVILTFAHRKLDASLWTRVFFHVPNVIQAYARPDSLIEHREAEGDALRTRHAIPRIRERVGGDSVDLLNWEQGLLILHRMNYQPRPVFQSYFAYTPKLMRLNEAHFLGENAPRFVLLKLQAVDDRFPQAEDALALTALFRTYVPVMEESGFLLMQRTTGSSVEPQPSPELQLSASFDDWIEVPETSGPVFVALHAEASLLGRLYAFWFRTPPLLMEAETHAGVRVTYRLQPKAMQAGFLLSPLLRDTEQLLDLYVGRPPETIKRFRLVNTSPAFSRMWSKTVRVGFGSLRWQQPSEAQRSRLVADTAPTDVGL